MPGKGARGAEAYCAVVNVTVERGQPTDPLSLPREAADLTVHRCREAARGRLLAELDLNLGAEAAAELRRSFLVAAEIPAAVAADGSPHRWMADRVRPLLAAAGARPDAYAAALGRGSLADLLAADLDAAVSALRASLDGGDTARAALEAAGAAARAALHGAVPDALARKATGVVRAIGKAAWAGADVTHLAPALDALLDETGALVVGCVGGADR